MNKICLTEKGKQLLEDQPEEAIFPTGPISTRQEFPEIRSTLRRKFRTLSKMSLEIEQLKKKGLYRIQLENQDRQVSRRLRDAVKEKREYLRTVVPSLVRLTRNAQKPDNLINRVERGRAYLERLQQNFNNQSKIHSSILSQKPHSKLLPNYSHQPLKINSTASVDKIFMITPGTIIKKKGN